MSMTRGEMFFSGKLEDANRESTSHTYLGGHALQWFEEERPGDKTFEEIIALFKEKFSKRNTAEDGSLIAEAHQLTQNKDKSQNVCRVHRQTLPPNVTKPSANFAGGFRSPHEQRRQGQAPARNGPGQALHKGQVGKQLRRSNSHFRRRAKCHLELPRSSSGTTEGFGERGQQDRAAGHDDAADRLESRDGAAHIRAGKNNAASSGKRPKVKLELAAPIMMPDKAPAELHRRHNHATLTTTGASAAGNGATGLGDAQKGRMGTLQREQRKIVRRENSAAERTSTDGNCKDHHDGTGRHWRASTLQ
ncbi:hypothetical protein FOBRF1_013213 [Fusarium oxysporum]